MNQTRDELIQEAREYLDAIKEKYDADLANAPKTKQEFAEYLAGILADFALKTRTDTLAEVAAELRKLVAPWQSRNAADIINQFADELEKLKQAGGRDG